MLFALESFPSSVMISSLQTLKSGQEKCKTLLGEKQTWRRATDEGSLSLGHVLKTINITTSEIYSG